MPTRIEYTSTFKDYLHAQRAHAKRNAWSRINDVAIRKLAPIWGGVILILALLSYSPGAWRAGYFQVMIGCAVILVLYPLYIRYRLNRCYKRTRIGDGSRVIDLDEHLIKVQEGATRSELEWSAIQFIREDKNVLMLYLAPAKFLLVPKRCCPAQTLDEVKRLYNSSRSVMSAVSSGSD